MTYAAAAVRTGLWVGGRERGTARAGGVTCGVSTPPPSSSKRAKGKRSWEERAGLC